MYSSSSHHGSGSSSHLDQKKITAKDLDHVLSEMTLLEARAEMYYKFVRKRVTVRMLIISKLILVEIACFYTRPCLSFQNDLEVSTSDSDIRARALLDLERLMTQSGLFYSMQDLLAEYILLEDYFMSENVAKAITEDRDGGKLQTLYRTGFEFEDTSFSNLEQDENELFFLKKGMSA